MQRILNNPDNIVDEMLKGFLKAHSDIVEATDNGRVVKAKDIPEEKLAVCREVLQQMSGNLSGDEKKREEITDHE